MEIGNTYDLEVDWRNRYGKNYITSVKNQGNHSLCIYFGLMSVFESMILIEHEDIEDIDLSEADLFASTNSGNLFVTARNRGVVPESYYPYFGSNIPSNYRESNIYNRKEISWQYDQYYILTGLTEQKWWLTNIGPVASSLTNVHTVCIVGYSESEQKWIYKNSWGTSWGYSGYGYSLYNSTGETMTESIKYGIVGTKRYDSNVTSIHINYPEIENNYPTNDIEDLDLRILSYNDYYQKIFLDLHENCILEKDDVSWLHLPKTGVTTEENINYCWFTITLEQNEDKCPRLSDIIIKNENNEILRNFKIMQKRQIS